MANPNYFKEITGDCLSVEAEVIHPTENHNNLEWIVGTVGSGIIICEALCSKSDIEEGSIFSHLAFYVQGSDVRDPGLITWYIYSNPCAVSRSVCYDYRQYLKTHPEVGFLTIYEIGMAKHFLKLNHKDDNIFMKFVDAKKYGTEDENGQSVRNQENPDEPAAPEYNFKKGIQIGEYMVETDFDMRTPENENVVSENGAYFRIFSRDKQGKIIMITDPAFFYDNKLVNDNHGLEEAAVKLVALRCANLMCPEEFKVIPWKLTDSNHGTCINIYKLSDPKGKYPVCENKASFEIMIYRSRNYRRQRFLKS